MYCFQCYLTRLKPVWKAFNTSYYTHYKINGSPLQTQFDTFLNPIFNNSLFYYGINFT